MDESQFQSHVKNEITSAVNYYDTEFSGDRQDTLSYYLGEPFGNEVEGRSSVVCTEVSDVIEYLMPSLMKIFASSNKFVRFAGRKKEDVKSAEQATELVNYVINSQNNGFKILHNFFKDGLLFKLGAVKFYWEESESTVEEKYSGLSENELTLLLDDPDIELVSQEMTEVGNVDEMGQEQPIEQTFSVEVKRRLKGGKVKIDNIPPEELIFSRRATSLEDCDFIAHRTEVRAGDLIEQGYDADLVLKLAGGENLDDEPERQQRHQEISSSSEQDSSDPSMRNVLVTEGYIKCDYNNDNIPELRRIVCLGESSEIVENEPFDHVPFALLSPVLMPHRMVGRSVAEMVMDLQKIKSSIFRNMLDNLYLTNNQRVAVVEGQVNLDDLLTSRPAGIVRMRNQGMVQPLSVPQMSGQAFNMLEYVDQVRDQRTGFSKASMGLDPKVLQSTSANAVNQTIQGSALKVEMIARVFAETGCRDLAFGVLQLLQKHQTKPMTIRLRNEYVDIDPRAFENEFDLEVDIGVGNGKEEEKMQMLVQIAGKQEQLLQQLGANNPVVKPSQYVNTLRKIAEMAGFKDTEQFFSSGEEIDQALAQPPQEEQQPDLELQMKMKEMEAEIALKREKMQAEIQLKREEMMAKIEARKQEFQAELSLRQQKLALGGEISTNLPNVQ